VRERERERERKRERKRDYIHVSSQLEVKKNLSAD
jgi:hypothetical protein